METEVWTLIGAGMRQYALEGAGSALPKLKERLVC